MWLFRKSSEEHELLTQVFQYLPKLEQAYSLRKELTVIFYNCVPNKNRNWVRLF
jgi:hypothetical protein